MLFIVKLLLSVLVVYSVYHSVLSIQRWNRAKNHGCESPPRKPAENLIARVSKLLAIFKSSKSFSNHKELAELYKQYGNTFSDTTLTGRRVIRTVDEKNIQAVFSTNSTAWLVGPMRWSGMHEFMGNGFITTDGPVWERSRNLLKPSFHKSSISDLTSFEQFVTKMIKQIPSHGAPVDLQPLLIRMFTDSSTDFLLGKSIDALNTEAEPDETPTQAQEFWKAFQLSMRGCGLRLFAGPFKRFVPKRLTSDQFDVVHRYIDTQVARALQEKNENEKQEKEMQAHHANLLSDLVRQTDDHIEIRNQLINALAAAQDTTPTLVSNCIFYLSRYPDLWVRVREEAASVGTKSLTAEDTKRLRFIHNILHESLRLHPVFPNLGRMAGVDTILPTGGGPDGLRPIYVVAGTRLMSDFYSLHRDESIYGSNPNSFDPDRWDRISPGPWSFMGFGGGPKSCLGQNKALAEASCVLVRLAQQFSRVESRDDQDWTGAMGLISRNMNGCQVAFSV